MEQALTFLSNNLNLHKMKNIKIYILAFALLLSSTACEKYVSKDDFNPNQPTSSTLPTLLPTVEVAVFATYTGQISRTSGLWIQHFQGTDQQMIDISRYEITENGIQNDWNTIYASGIVNAKDIITKADALGAPYYKGIAQICYAMLVGVATDYWNDVPNTQAGLGVANLTPQYETQEAVITSIQTMLSEAIGNLQTATSANSVIPASDDLIHNGDRSLWIKAAYLLKARYSNRLSQRNATTSATQALANLTAGGWSGNADNTYARFSGAGNELNSWYAFENQRGNYIKMNATLVNKMIAKNDPRISFYCKPDNNGNFTGTPIDDYADISTSSIGNYFAGPDATTLPLLTFAEAKFIEAEANLRLGQSAAAQTAFTEAITAAMDYPGIDAAAVSAYLTNYGTLSGSTSDQLAQIMDEKYVALFTQLEPYHDWRRTNLPVLNPATTGVQATIPVRFPTEQNERLYNPNAVVVSNTTTRVWWDN
jgi:hypothetical protein